MGDSPTGELLRKSKELGLDICSSEFSSMMDDVDPFSSYRGRFIVPHIDPEDSSTDEVIYMCGNSLGLQPVSSREHVLYEMEEWAKRGVEGHFHHTKKDIKPWVAVDENVHHLAAEFVVGAKASEVAIMGGLTANLHFMMAAFYRPQGERNKILIEAKAFPSDWYAVESQIRLHGLDPRECLIQLAPRDGEYCLRTEDILKCIEKHGEHISLVMFSGIQYYTGQFFEIEKITAAGQDKGCMVGWDLAHAAGNVPLYLHDWNVDFACFCSYKYLNSGPGGIAGIFVHERHANDKGNTRLAGWWGHEMSTRFDMSEPFNPIPASLEVFKDAGGVGKLRSKSVLLTAYLELLLDKVLGDAVVIMTPRDPHQRGCQLSLKFAVPQESVLEEIQKRGVICDVRKPSSMRIAPTPLYNTFEDVRRFVYILKEALV